MLENAPEETEIVLEVCIFRIPLLYRDLGVCMKDPAPIVGRKRQRLIARLSSDKKICHVIKQNVQKFFRIIYRDVGHDNRTCTERDCCLLVALNTHPDEAYFCRDVPSDGPGNIENAHHI